MAVIKQGGKYIHSKRFTYAIGRLFELSVGSLAMDPEDDCVGDRQICTHLQVPCALFENHVRVH